MNNLHTRLSRLEGVVDAPVLIVLHEGETEGQALERTFGGGEIKSHIVVKTGVPRRRSTQAQIDHQNL